MSGRTEVQVLYVSAQKEFSERQSDSEEVDLFIEVKILLYLYCILDKNVFQKKLLVKNFTLSTYMVWKP